MVPEPATYQARYQWTPHAAAAVLIDISFVLVAVVLPMPLALSILVIAVFSFFGLYTAACAVSRKIAFRADQSGITLGGYPPRFRATTRFFPWADIQKIVLWERRIPWTIWRWTPYVISTPYIGLQRRPGSPPIAGDGTGRLDQPRATAPVPGIAAGAARQAAAWVLDPARLVAAVATYAPDVPIETADGQQPSERWLDDAH